jgi:hypothetical protein
MLLMADAGRVLGSFVVAGAAQDDVRPEAAGCRHFHERGGLRHDHCDRNAESRAMTRDRLRVIASTGGDYARCALAFRQ